MNKCGEARRWSGHSIVRVFAGSELHHHAVVTFFVVKGLRPHCVTQAFAILVELWRQNGKQFTVNWDENSSAGNKCVLNIFKADEIHKSIYEQDKITKESVNVISVGCLWHSHGKNPVRLYPKLQSQPIGLRKIFIDYLFFQANQSDCTKSVSIFNRFASSEERWNQNVPCQICRPWVFPWPLVV